MNKIQKSLLNNGYWIILACDVVVCSQMRLAIGTTIKCADIEIFDHRVSLIILSLTFSAKKEIAMENET
uniref:Uncharacterized protein n=1 Tax=Arundo donax TaxID=35708 RepID=A0A0A8Z6N3_ARUDO